MIIEFRIEWQFDGDSNDSGSISGDASVADADSSRTRVGCQYEWLSSVLFHLH